MPFGMRGLRRWLRGGPRARKQRPIHLLLESLEERSLLSANFVQTNLVSDIAGKATTTDPNLVNPWGLVAAGTQGPFWVANNVTGTSTLYNG
jgi:hypothetical protein